MSTHTHTHTQVHTRKFFTRVHVFISMHKFESTPFSFCFWASLGLVIFLFLPAVWMSSLVGLLLFPVLASLAVGVAVVSTGSGTLVSVPCSCLAVCLVSQAPQHSHFDKHKEEKSTFGLKTLKKSYIVHPATHVRSGEVTVFNLILFSHFPSISPPLLPWAQLWVLTSSRGTRSTTLFGDG